MNWLKAMLLMVVLGAILYGVNLVLNKSAAPESPANDGAWVDNSAPQFGPGQSPMNSPQGYGHSAGGPPAGANGYAASNGNRSEGSLSNSPPGYGQSGMAGNASPAANSYAQSPAPAARSTDAGPFGATSAAPNAGMPSANAATTNPPSDPSAAPSSYQPATPTVVNSDPSHAGIQTTPVGLVTGQPSTPAGSPGEGAGGGAAFASFMDEVTEDLRNGRLAVALQKLTLKYENPQLNSEENRQLNDLLGRLAGTVIYSRQHLLLPPYEVKQGDRLETIAGAYQVPMELLAKINGISDPDHMQPGEKLKVIHGPFAAIVNLKNREVMLLVQQCYAGRFTLSGVGAAAAGLHGSFKVDKKMLDASQTRNPELRSANHWIDVGGQFGFCALSDPKSPEVSSGLMLESRDAEDLFDILAVGSDIVVH